MGVAASGPPPLGSWWARTRCSGRYHPVLWMRIRIRLMTLMQIWIRIFSWCGCGSGCGLRLPKWCRSLRIRTRLIALIRIRSQIFSWCGGRSGCWSRLPKWYGSGWIHNTGTSSTLIYLAMFHINSQCCGTDTVYSGSDFGKVSVPVPVLPDPNPYPDSDHI